MNKKATFITRVALALGTFISLFFVPWLLLWAWILPLPDSVEDQLDQAIAHGLEGIIVYIDEKGQAPSLYAAGWHDKEHSLPANPEALFKLASIGKLYDAVAITKLAKSGHLSLQGTVADYFPELVGKIDNADGITVKMLVQHRSGIPNYTNAPNYWANPAHSYQQALDLIVGLPANFAPDSDYEYCNTNYLLLDKLIEKTTGKTKFDYLQSAIIAPLNLNHTFGGLRDVDLAKLMGGYHLGVTENLKTSDYGSMIATAQDVGIFVRALNEGTLFAEGEQAIYSSLYEYEHGGWIPGYQSHVKYYPEMDTVIVQFNNTTDSELYYWNLSEIIFNRIAKIQHR
jgi:D-alanyl-D-alanine carboxypeptidase